MEINKKELRKISRKFRTLASNVINSHYTEQNARLKEMIYYLEQTLLLKQYLKSLEYDIEDLGDLLNRISASYGREALDLGSDSNKRTSLLYRVYLCIIENNLFTYTFGCYYTSSNRYQDMAKAFGDRLVYPFVIEVENYIKDISTDMGYDEDNSLYNINVNSSGVQVNIAEDGGTINASQENKLSSEDVIKAINNVEKLIKRMESEIAQLTLSQNLDCIKNEISKKNPKKERLSTCLKSMHFIDNSISSVPDLASGIQIIASLIGLRI